MSNQLKRIDPENTPAVISGESATVLSVIQKAASDPNCDIEKLERLMNMHERMQSRQAEAAFNAAMAEMQIEIPSIAERGKTNNGKYATLEDINDVVRPIMQKYGFAISFRVETIQGGMKVTGVLMHRLGHREETTMTLPLDTSGSKNGVQAVGSSTSYGKRYVMCALLNITTRGADDDGYAACPQIPVVTEAQASKLRSMLEQCKPKTQEGFVNIYGEPESIKRADHDIALAQLTKALARDKEENKGEQNADNP